MGASVFMRRSAMSHRSVMNRRRKNAMSSPVVAAPSSVLSGTATGRQHAALFKHRFVRSCVVREARGGSRARRHGGARPRLAARLTHYTATQLWPHAIGCERIARAMDSNAKRSSDEARAHMNDTSDIGHL